MVRKVLVKGMELPKSAGIFCEKCVEEKMSQIIGDIHSTRRLDRVHSDMCVPMPTDSIEGKSIFCHVH